MVVVTPGIDFIARYLVTFNVPSSLFTLSLRALRTTYGFPIPTWALVCGAVTFVPLMSVARIMYTSFDNERRAAVLGARPEHIKLILSTDFDNYVKGKQFHGSMFSVLGSSIFTSDGDDWK